MKSSKRNLADVAKNVAHRFHSIEEELTVLVFFALAEYSLKMKGDRLFLVFILPVGCQ